jgi:stage V sporulation protein G
MPTKAKESIFSQIHVSLFKKDALRALVSCKVADAVYLTGLRVIEGKSGLFVSMPSRKTTMGEYQDIYFPASKAMRDELQAAVLEAYSVETAKKFSDEDLQEALKKFCQETGRRYPGTEDTPELDALVHDFECHQVRGAKEGQPA